MTTFRLLLAELWHRRMNVVLSLVALVVAATLFVAGPTLLDGYRRESDQRLTAMERQTAAALAAMRAETDRELLAMQQKADQDLAELELRTVRIMRNLGFNLRIVHRDTDMNKLYANFVALDMPEEYVKRLAESPQITKIAHLVATLRQMVQWEDQPRLLVGFAPEAVQTHVEQKAPMGLQVERGKVYLGALAGQGHKVGDAVEILGKSFTVGRILPPHGTAEEDIAICMHLADAQEVLDKPGRISEILALGCKCKTVNRVEEITEQLEAVLPEARVTEMRMQAIARQDQRNLVSQHYAQTISDYKANRAKIADQEAHRRQEVIDREREHRAQVLAVLAGTNAVVTPMVVLACALWVGLLAWANVRERRTEIGLLRALGKSSLRIASLFLGKATLLGFCGGLTGCLLGYVLARWLATRLLDVSLANFTPSAVVLLCTIAGTPIVAALASYLPTLVAINQDPAIVLVDN